MLPSPNVSLMDGLRSPSRTPRHAAGESFTIGGPSKKRTKGKKKLSQRLTSCSVL